VVSVLVRADFFVGGESNRGDMSPRQHRNVCRRCPYLIRARWTKQNGRATRSSLISMSLTRQSRFVPLGAGVDSDGTGSSNPPSSTGESVISLYPSSVGREPPARDCRGSLAAAGQARKKWHRAAKARRLGMGLAYRETKNQAMVFYGHAEHDIPGASNPVIVSM
jgi:hypothetical protein